MMKCVLALVVLLHLCSSVKPNMALNTAIIRRLDSLSNKTVNITSQDVILIPSHRMRANAASCVGVFIRELKRLLNNVTVDEENTDTLEELEASLNGLGPHQENDQLCPMTQRKRRQGLFGQYAYFLRKLNASTRR